MFRELSLRIPQPIRFVIAGGSVSVLYLCTTLALNALGLHIQPSILIGYTAGLVLHFTLQRTFVFANHDEFSLQIHHQLGRYLLVAGTQYLATAGLTAALPGVLGLDERIVYVGVVVVLTAITFVINRTFVFHGDEGDSGEHGATTPG